MRLIRAFAESTAKPTVVYNLAQIPPPASPSPAPPPAQPTDLTVTLDASGGSLTLRWKAANPAGTSGTSYIIRRRPPYPYRTQLRGFAASWLLTSDI